MKKKIKRDKVEPYKISATIFTNEELERLNHKIGIDLDNIVNQIIDNVYINRELILFQIVIEKQQKEIEKLQSKKYIFNAETNEIKEIPISDDYISKDKIEAKIEKIKEDEKFYRERDRMYEFNGKINILKELLGE